MPLLSRAGSWFCLIVGVVGAAPASAAELVECQRWLIVGEYQKCIEGTTEAIMQNRFGEAWPVTKAQAEVATGQSAAALQTVKTALERYNWSVRLRWIGIDAARLSGDGETAKKLFDELVDHATRFAWRYTDSEEIVVLGKMDLLNGVDPKTVLSQRYEKAKQRNSRSRDAWLAIGELALDKHDSALAAEALQEALKLFPEDPDVHFGLVLATSDSQRDASAKHLEAALKANERHVPSLLYQVELMIDSEAYDAANEMLAAIEKINPQQPEQWAYRAVIAHLKSDAKGETAFREKALSQWKNNPRVDHLIGRKLSQHYRFTEGAVYQERCIKLIADEKLLEPSTLAAAKRQLAEDYLRLGREEVAWNTAEEARKVDEYDVATFNLLELRDSLSKFTTLEDDEFILRMETKEARLYGAEALALLKRARRTLGDKYGLKLDHKITVEIFADPDDFAVRTFGMPAVSGYLGVCFGRVITANSPASRRENPSNWQAVLWHEFCHVVTLQMTHNRIPRWLSEGISVYEELQANSAWGQRMDPRSRQHILDGGLTPLSQLSGAFMRPASGWHLNFAYFESALAVEFIVKTHGMPALRNVLTDLAAGLPINTALDRRCEPLANMEPAFEAYCRQRAEALAPGTDFSKPDLAGLLNADNDEFEVWVREHPKSFIGAMANAEKQLAERDWAEAETALKKLIQLYPNYIGGDNAYEKLARVYRELKRPTDETATLMQFTKLDGSAVAARLRLIELQKSAADWTGLSQTATGLLAVDPLLKAGYEATAQSAEQLKQPEQAVAALERILLLEPDDLADTHYRLAKALQSVGRAKDARRQVLMALEEAPRFRAAQELLLQLAREKPAATN